ncbi:SET domain-containing protein [Guyanagaster necrorhizus]|uniref:Histone-lysine N-methyltransferase SET5 n=1 Tax=Guyanagaster necrorhizus TaxID=856835 RepID=A0A9P8AWG7_9AGAR|nr:SET domain-containing protein [Guyanagaster necrorhizus MCA 3950]KAG7450171.1 SET domain-containing protein [Guyanagaster necrorhizus MCA 3950]
MLPIVPDDETIQSVISIVQPSLPGLDTNKLHDAVIDAYPEWQGVVGEKRVRRVMANSKKDEEAEGPIKDDNASTITTPKTKKKKKAKAKAKASSRETYPTSSLLPDSVLTLPPTVAVRYFDKQKGKGLVALRRIEEGETLWKEDPWIIAPEWDIFDLQQRAVACAHCTTPFSQSSALVVSCQHCSARYCTRLCFSRSVSTHPLLCPGQNAASVPLLKQARSLAWMALHAISRVTARVLLGGEQEWDVVKAMAELGMEERFQKIHLTPERETWKRVWTLYVDAFRSPQALKIVAKSKKPLAEQTEKELFSYEGFLRGLGRMSLNLESHGGLYLLHSHLNHSCDPNLSIRHLQRSSALARITVIAKRAILPGEELIITYVDPSLDIAQRRQALGEWGFGNCTCSRCNREAATVEDESQGQEKRRHESSLDMKDLERELKEGLGLWG